MTLIKSLVLLTIFFIGGSGLIDIIVLSMNNIISDYFTAIAKMTPEKLDSLRFEATMRFLLGFIAYCAYQILEECRKIRSCSYNQLDALKTQKVLD